MRCLPALTVTAAAALVLLLGCAREPRIAPALGELYLRDDIAGLYRTGGGFTGGDLAIQRQPGRAFVVTFQSWGCLGADERQSVTATLENGCLKLAKPLALDDCQDTRVDHLWVMSVEGRPVITAAGYPKRATTEALERSGAVVFTRQVATPQPSAEGTLAIDPALIDRITMAADFFTHRPELMYFALQDDPVLLRRLVRLVPLAVLGDCTCGAGEPGDVAAVIVSAAFAADPKLAVLDGMTPIDREAILSYLDSVQPTDWSPEVKAAIQARFPASP